MALNSDKYKKNMQDGAKATKEAAASADELKQNINDLGKIIILDHIQDPQNIGAIARTSVFFGVSTIIIPNLDSFLFK